MAEVGYRRTIYCHEIFKDDICCSNCKDLHPNRTIYLGPPHIDGMNYDYLIPLDLYTCCLHFHVCKMLPREWWLAKMESLGLKMVIMNPKGGIDYKAMGLIETVIPGEPNTKISVTSTRPLKYNKIVMCKSCKEEEAEKQGYCSNCARLRGIR